MSAFALLAFWRLPPRKDSPPFHEWIGRLTTLRPSTCRGWHYCWYHIAAGRWHPLDRALLHQHAVSWCPRCCIGRRMVLWSWVGTLLPQTTSRANNVKVTYLHPIV